VCEICGGRRKCPQSLTRGIIMTVDLQLSSDRRVVFSSVEFTKDSLISGGISIQWKRELSVIFPERIVYWSPGCAVDKFEIILVSTNQS
jgi:hypothetical protein